MQESVCNRNCKGCVYNAEVATHKWGYCNYIFVERKRRPCPAGKGCTVKKIGRTRRAEND